MEYSLHDQQEWFCNGLPSAINNKESSMMPHSMMTYTPPYLQTFSIDPDIPCPLPRSAENTNSVNSINTQLTNLTVKKPDCPQCRGWKHNFTAYFHNTRIFSNPPHDFINFVETDYVLTNHLNSLLNKYRQGLQHDSTEGVEMEIKGWVMQVAALATEVRFVALDSQSVVKALEDVMTWADEMGSLLWGRVAEFRRFEVEKGGIRRLVTAFRKVWERVWVACVQGDRGLMDVVIDLPAYIVRGVRG